MFGTRPLARKSKRAFSFGLGVGLELGCKVGFYRV